MLAWNLCLHWGDLPLEFFSQPQLCTIESTEVGSAHVYVGDFIETRLVPSTLARLPPLRADVAFSAQESAACVNSGYHTLRSLCHLHKLWVFEALPFNSTNLSMPPLRWLNNFPSRFLWHRIRLLPNMLSSIVMHMSCRQSLFFTECPNFMPHFRSEEAMGHSRSRSHNSVPALIKIAT